MSRECNLDELIGKNKDCNKKPCSVSGYFLPTHKLNIIFMKGDSRSVGNKTQTWSIVY